MSSSSSSKSNPKWVYDVFLNFRGEDTRRGFVSHLHSSLSDAGVLVYVDYQLDKGAILKPELLRAIEGSRMSLVIFSENYANSSWCLDELLKILECRRNLGQIVVPIFYGVDPSDVRHQWGAFGSALADLDSGDLDITDDVIAIWMRALTEAANLAGWDSKNRNERDLVEDIVDDVLGKLEDTLLPITDFPVGLDSRVEEVIQFLDGRPSTSSVVGIWGMGGSGKTTLAKAIYNKIHSQFKSRSFLQNIREVWEKDRGQTDLQEQLLSDILRKRKMKIHSTKWGKDKIKEILCSKKALILLDDVDKFEQLNALCANREWISAKSVVIVTTRDVRLLDVFKVDYLYKMKEMDNNESFLLFNCHAFKEESPKEDFIELSRNVVSYCRGLPLALEVLGSYLYKRTIREWESVLSKLETIPNNQVQKKLKISFDGLEDQMEKDIFLDICCFFIGMDRAYVTEILNGCKLYADIGITILIERSLIKVERNNKLAMHDLLRDMGREIVCQSSPKEPEKRSRLWFHEDVDNVLREKTGTKAIEGLAFKLQSSRRACFSAKAFEKMKRLRLLQLDHVQLVGDYRYLPKHLRWICWHGFPLEYTPNNFCQRHTVAIDLRHSNLRQVWKEAQILERLKFLNLSHSRYLIETPDFSKLPNLEKLILKDCPSLSKVHQSIGELNNLLLINLKDCTSLRNLPRMAYKLKSLKTLIISGCSLIDKLEEDIEQMESLTTLIATDTAVRQIPFSILRSKSIGYISLCGYEGLSRDVFPSLIWSWMSPRMNLVSCIHPFGSMASSLVQVDVQNKNLGDLSLMHSSLSKLRTVCVQYPSELQLTQDLKGILVDMDDVNFTELGPSHASQISQHSLRSLSIGMGSYNQVFNTLSKSLSQELIASESGNCSLPGDNYPYWLTHIGEGRSVLFHVPQVSGRCMKGMILCVVHSCPENMADKCLVSVFIINYTKCTIQLYKRDTVMSFNDEDWQGLISNLQSGDKVEIFVAFGHGLIVKKTAVYLIYGKSVARKWAFTGAIKKWVFKT